MTEENKRLWEYYRWWIKEDRKAKIMVKNNPKMKSKPNEKDWDEMRKIKGV